MAHLQDLLVRLEPVLLALVVLSFFRSGSARRLPAMATYLVIRLSSLIALEVVLNGGPTPMQIPSTRYAIYFYGYWFSYVAAAVAIFFVIQEVFRRVMEPAPGLRRLGLLAFRWISIVSVVVCVGAVTLPATMARTSSHRVGPLCLQLARCASVMELCLLAFLALSIHALGRSFRSPLFGISLGFGMQAAADLVFTAVSVRYPGLNSAAALGLQVATLVVLLTFTLYFLLPEPQAERSMIVLPPSSMLARWNALAKGLGQMPEPVMVPNPTGFFLQDIEGVVDRVLAKNPVVAPR